MSSFKFFWTTHKWVGIIAAVVFVNTAATGFMLLIKKRVAWIQPPEQRGVEENVLTVSFDEILAAARSRPELQIESWEDIDRLDVRPGMGMLKIRANNNWEAQIDLATGEVLQTAFRRSDTIETIHDGSFYGEWVHAFLMPAISLCLLYLVCSGLYLWIEPTIRKRRRTKRAERMAAETAGATRP